MSSQILLTPLGDQNENDFFSFILQIDSSKILLDCGCTESFQFDIYNKYKSQIQEIDCILISHADLKYLGALPYIVEKFNLTCPIYTTVPVHNMGLMTLYDTLQMLGEEGLAPTSFSLDDVDSCFDKMIRLRFMQTVILSGLGKGISIVPLAAGHSIGACLWRLIKNNEDVVYAVDFNHKKERHLDGINLEALSKPSLLVTNSNSIFSLHRNKKQRDSDFVDSTISALRTGGSVLVPVKSATRVLEILLLLEQTWESQNLAYPIYFLSQQSYRVTEFAKSMLEWMGESVIKTFGNTRNNPFIFSRIKLVSTIEECNETTGPKVFLATTDSLLSGYSKQIFLRLVTNPLNLIIFVSERKLYDSVKQTGSIEFELRQRVLLMDKELAAYKQQQNYLQEKKKADATFDAILQKKMKSEEVPSDDENEDNLAEAEMKENAGKVSRKESNSLERLKLVYWYDYQYDFYVSDQIGKTRSFNQMFPFVEKRIKFDEYGETIQPSDFSSLLSIGDDNLPVAQRKEEPIANEPPFKWVSSKINVKIVSKMAYIDFEGLSDGRSIKTIISRISPRKLVIVGGNHISRQYMMQFCKVADEITNNVSVASPHQTCNISSSLDIFTVRIDEGLLASLQVKAFSGYELAHVVGVLEVGDKNKVLCPLQNSDQHLTLHEPFLVGNPKLFQVKRQLLAQGLQAELISGQLKCGNIFVKKNSAISGSFVLEGPLSVEYYAVRDALYSQMILI